MVQACMEFVDKIQDVDKRVELIQTLNVVTTGKVSKLFQNPRLVLMMRLDRYTWK